MNDFELKYDGIELKLINPRMIDDPAECEWLMGHLDQIVGHIEEQLELSMHPDPVTGAYRRHDLPVWRARATRALRGARSLRQSVQNRFGMLRRQQRMELHEQGNTVERTFVDVARERLTGTLFHEFLTEAKRRRDGEAI